MVAGNAKYMPKQVEDAFRYMLTTYMNDDEEADKIINNLIANKQYIVEAW